MNHYVVSSVLTIFTTSFLTVFVYFKNRRSRINRRYVLYSLSVAFWSFCYFRMITSSDRIEGLFWSRALNVGAIFIPMLFLDFGLVLLEIEKQNKRVIVLGYSVCFMLLAFLPTSLFVADAIPKFAFRYFIVPGPVYHIFAVFFFSCVVYTQYILFYGFKKAQGLRRNQIKYVFLGYLIAYIGAVTIFLPLYNIPTPRWGIYLIPLCMVLVTYAIVKYRLMDIRVAVTRAGTFLLVYTLILGFPLYVGYMTKSWVISTSLAVIFGTMGPIIYRLLHRKAEELLLIEQRNYQKLLLKGVKGIMKEHRLDKLLKWIVSVVKRTVGIRYTALFLNDKKKKIFLLKAKEDNGEIPDGLVFSYEHPFIDYMQKKKSPFFYEEIPLPIRRSLDIPFEIDIVIPSFIEGTQLGFLVLGEKLNQQFYSQDDLNVFNILANQAGLAIENAQLYGELQKETEKLKEALNKLNETQDQLIQSEKMAAVGTLSAGMAHEINNPLMGAMLLLQGLLSKKEYNSGDQERLFEVEKELERIAKIISKLLVFSRKEELVMERLDINAVMRDTLPLISHEFELNGVNLMVDYGVSLPLIHASKNAIQQVLINILLNAKDAVLDSGVKRVTISAFPHDNMVKVRIRDEGQGIKKENINKIFDPFFTTKPAGKGLGMGMCIARTIMDHHGGTIDVYSKERKGTEVILSFPGIK